MTSCPSDERLVQLLEEQLDRRELVDLERHLERCDQCQGALEELTRERFSFDDWQSWSDHDPADRERWVQVAPAQRSRRHHHSSTSPSAVDPDLPEDSIPEIEGYEILERIGQGGMGIVYKARQHGLERLVALKVIRGGSHAAPEHLARFRIEARAVARLGHPNVVQIHDVGRSAGGPFVAFELLEGGSLDARVAGTPQPETSSAELMVTLARAMAAAHRAGVVHRDLKSANVLFSSDATPKIADFGLAKRLDEEDGQTQTGQVMGSPSFMAPEQARGREVGPLADVYSLGAIFYEMLTGRPPFKGSSPMETLFQVIHDEPVPPTRLRPGLSRDLETISLKCLAKEPARRYESADALADDLDRYLAGTPILARPIGFRERVWKWARRQPALASLTLLIFASFAGVGAYASVNYRNEVRRTRLEQQEAAELQKRGNQVIDDGQTALRDHDYDAGLRRLNGFLPSIAGKPRVAELSDQIRRLIVRLDESQEQEKREKAAKAQLARFRSLRLRAQIDNTTSVGFGEFRDLEAVRRGITQALEIFGPGDPKTDPKMKSFTDLERQEIARGRYELLLILAEAVATPLPGENPKRQAEQALAILDQAGPRSSTNTADLAYRLIRAECLARKGDVVAANLERKSASTRPADGFGHLLLGEALHRQRKWKEAAREFETALRLEPDLFRAQLLLAVCQIQQQEFKQARTNLTACIQREPRAISLYLLRGFASGEEAYHQQFELARLKLTRKTSDKIESLPKDIEVLFEAAETDFESAVNLQPRPEEKYGLLVNRGALRLRRQRFDDAVNVLIEATGLRPDEVSAYIVLGQAYRQQKRVEAAIDQFSRGIALKPDLALLYRSRALTRLDRGQPSPEARDQSIQDLTEAIRLDSPVDKEFAHDRARRARLLLQGGRAREALTDCEDALRAFPSDADALLVRVKSLLELKQFDEVISACDEALSRSNPSGELYELRGLARASRMDYTGAIQDYTQSLTLDPNRSTPLIQRGWAYLVSDASNLAFNDFDEAIRIAPDEPDPYSGRGLARVIHGQAREAVDDAEASLSRGSNDPRTHYNAARIYAKAANVVNSGNQRRASRPLAETYQDRAQTLVRLALERMPAAERAEFWRTVVEADPALVTLRQRPKFSQLASQFGRQAK